MSILDSSISRLDGTPATLGELTAGRPALLVNVASKCGLTPQYTGLEQLQEKYAERGFTVVGLPCNQFMGQEPGTAEEIQEFCSATYGVTFPMTEKIEVNGDDRHEIYRALTQASDEKGETGDVQWNFEKYLIDGEGEGARALLSPRGAGGRASRQRHRVGPGLAVPAQTAATVGHS